MKQRITTVSGDYAQGSFGLLPLAGDRARAALHFARLIGSASTDGAQELARWNLRASLSEFRSIFDLLNSDLRSMGVLSQWEASPQKVELDSDATVIVMRKVRDFAIHSAVVRGTPKTFRVRSPGADQNPGNLEAIVIEPLEIDSPAVRREITKIPEEAVLAFNEQAASWPADLLMQIAVFRASEPIAGFLKAQRRDEA